MENENYKGVNPDPEHGENCERDLPGAEHEMDDEEAAKERLTSDDLTKVKFTSVSLDHAGKNGEAKVDIEGRRGNVGMGKEELMKYANDPFWVRTRMALFVLFWVIWVAMLVGAVVIILLAPRCAPPPRLDWWQKTVIYQVYVSSFKDGDSDGRGDLKGLVSKLDYLHNDLKVDTLLLSPIYPSPLKDNGYDISNYTDIDSRFGTLDDFKELVNEMKKRDMKVIIDFVPNHSSSEHPWFKASEKKEKPYDNYYVWSDGKLVNGERKPPNNWISVFGKSAWQWSYKRQQYYLHQFLPEQPDLNLRNDNVTEEMKNILEFWLQQDVDGFRVDAATHMFEDLELRDEPVISSSIVEKEEYESLRHIYTKAQPEVFEILGDWRMLLHNYSVSTGMSKILITEAYDDFLNITMRYYGTSQSPLVDIPFNFQLLDLTGDSSAEELKERMIQWTDHMPEGKWPNWVLGNHDRPRLATRVDRELIDGFHMTFLLAKGTPVCYYGDELGMENYKEVKTDFRDPARTPMQWSNDTNAGFTDAPVPWLPVHPDYTTFNVEMEKKNPQSHLEIFKALVALREQPAIQFGVVEYPLVTEDVFSMLRVRKGSPGYLIAMNMGSNGTLFADFRGRSKYLPEFGHVEIRSNNIVGGPLSEADRPKIKLNNVVLGPKQSVVFSFIPVFE